MENGLTILTIEVSWEREKIRAGSREKIGREINSRKRKGDVSQGKRRGRECGRSKVRYREEKKGRGSGCKMLGWEKKVKRDWRKEER